MMVKLPSIYKTVTIDCLGDVTKQRWTGSFEVKAILSNADRFEIERIYSKLMPVGTTPSEEQKIEASTIAELAVRVASGPSWWDSTRGGQLMAEMNPLYDLMQECSKAQKAWSDEVDKMAEMGDGNVIPPQSN
jgi:hypothetical protein